MFEGILLKDFGDYRRWLKKDKHSFRIRKDIEDGYFCKVYSFFIKNIYYSVIKIEKSVSGN